MSEIGQNLKNMVKKGIEAIGNTAGTIASTTKQKVEAYNLSNERNDLYAEIGRKFCSLAQQHSELSDVFEKELKRISEINDALSRLQKDEETAGAEGGNGTVSTQESTTDDAPQTEFPVSEAAVYTAEDDQDIPVLQVEEKRTESEADGFNPLSSAINDLFENKAPVDKMVERVNSSLDEIGDSLRKISNDFDHRLSELTDEIMGKDDKGGQ